MGMDVYGRNPNSPLGKYFRANILTWSPIYSLIVRLCSDLFEKDTLRSMVCNEGAGPPDQKICTEMANRFELWMEHHVDGLTIDSSNVETGGICDFLKKLADNNSDLEVIVPGNPNLEHKVDDEKLKTWIEFLRHCGGFEVH